MAQIDLKKATIKIFDGSVGAATVLTAGATAGDTLIKVTSATGFAVGGIVKMETDPEIYYITAIATLDVSITPGLARNYLLGDDAQPGPGNYIEVKIGEGNLTYTETKNMEYMRDKGSLDIVREGDEEPVEVSLDAVWEFITASSGGTETIEDAFKQRGEASGWESTSDDPCEPYCVDIVVEYELDCGSEEDEVLVLRMFRYESIAHDLRAGTLAFSGKCNILEPIVFRCTLP